MFVIYSPPPSELLGLRILFFIISLIGLALTDFFYIATVINYAFQCQLIFCAINATNSRLSNRKVEVDHAIKVWWYYNLCIILITLYINIQEIKTLQDFLKVLNGKFSSLVSMQLYVFIGLTISSMYEHTSIQFKISFRAASKQNLSCPV